MAASSDPDTIRILVATDNHVGYNERDPIRKDDSWKTFDEIMKLAKSQDVDMVLLGGDLFHDNKPSRKSMYQVMRSIRQNCLGYKPVELQFMSDANEIFEGAFGHVNYEDENINVSIPVFSIHGNHDDPSGDGHFCSLDLLQVAGLVNYFGRVPEADDIKVKPVFLQKGRTKLSLYGMSNVRDERMFRTFRDHKVTFFRPDQQPDDFFNLLVVHQNHHAHSATNYLPEESLPDWMDLVVWGHEHECKLDPIKNPETGFHVIQPGSSVATSLCPGEAVSKHVAILSVTGREFTVEKIPLKTVRPFIMREVVLGTDPAFKGLAHKKDNKAEITKRLIHIVNEMIQEADDEWKAVRSEEEYEDEDDKVLPLIRLLVEYTAPEGGAFIWENPQRFSNRFVGRVANVTDVVKFHKKNRATKRSKGDVILPSLDGDADLSVIKVETLVEEFLTKQQLKVLNEPEFADAVNQYVTKDDNHAMEDFVRDSLVHQLQDMLALQDDENAAERNIDEDMEALREARVEKNRKGEVVQRQKTKYKPKPVDWDSDFGHWKDQPEAIITEKPANPAKKSQARGSGRAATGRSAVQAPSSDFEDILMEDAVEEEEEPPRKANAKRGSKAAPVKAAATSTTRGRKKGPFEDEDDEDDEDDYMFVDQVEESPPPPAPAKRASASRATTSRTAASASARSTTSRNASASNSRQTRLNFSQSQAPATERKKAPAKRVEISDDEISDDDDDAFETMPTTRSRRR